MAKNKLNKVSIVMGSQSDYKTMTFCQNILKKLNIKFETKIISAHRTPKRMYEFASSAEKNNIGVIIAGAGGSAHLPGMIAALSPLPVLGVPIESKKLKGLDSLLSIAQMPKGIPVGTLAIGEDGAINAALLAASIIANNNASIKKKLNNLRLSQTKSVKKNLNKMSDITLGIIGGGQLGSMLAISAKKLNIKTIIYSDDPDAPAQNFCNKFISGDYNNKEKIIEFVNLVNYVTYEFENIPFETLNEINKLKPVLPKPSVNRLIQHRLAEKDFVNNLNIRTTRYASVENKSEIEALEDLLPGILKTTTLGYDGKGQYPINSIEEFNGLNIDYSKGYILEKLVKLKKEISIIITRFNDQKYEIYEPIENKHEDQILKFSKIPADIDKKIYDQSREWAMSIAEELKYIGTLCVEFFIDRNDNLYVNEIAPRVHNSGHLTINAYNVSQFENHVRAVCGLEQVPLKKLSNATMVNLIGDQISEHRKFPKFKDNEFFFDYLKKEIKEKRKMGHITTLV